MKICFITGHFDQFRGGSTLLADLFRTISPRHDITIITKEDRFSDRKWNTELVEAPASTSFPWLSERGFAEAAVCRFDSLHRKRPFDLIMVNQTIGDALLRLREAGIPIIYIIHHPVSVDRSVSLVESESVWSRLYWLLHYGFMVNTQRRLARELGKVLTVSVAAQKRVAADYAMDPVSIAVIINGVDTEFYRKTSPTQRRTVLAVGSYQHPRRGFRYLLDAYRLLSARGFTILDIGRRTNRQDALLRLIPGIEIHELVPTREKLRDLYSRASVTISTSLYEGFGLSLAESLSCGTPAVAFDAGGTRDVLRVIDEHLLCPIRDVKTLVDRAQELDELDDRVEVSRKYRESIVSHFSLSRMARQYEDLFASVIDAH